MRARYILDSQVELEFRGELKYMDSEIRRVREQCLVGKCKCN
jgi:hypothetical protein